jgi:hypothetical protein
MRGVIAISTCRGGSFLSDPPAFRPRLRRRVAPPKIQIQQGFNLKKSNREALRLEIHVTQTKQTTGDRSNREKEAGFSNDDQPTRSPRKSRGAGSPRPRVGFGCCLGSGSIALGIGNTHGHSGRVVNPLPYAEKRTQIGSTNRKCRPPKVLRLKTTPLLYFVKFTRNFNRTMLRLERIAKRTKNGPADGRKGGVSDQRAVRRFRSS